MAEPDEQVNSDTAAQEPPHEPIPDEADDQPSEEEEAAEAGAHEPAEASQPQGDDQKAVRELEKKIAKERDQHGKRLGTILGDASTDTLPCPLCFNGLMGFVLPGDAEHMPDDQRAAALAFLGVEGGGELQPAEGVEMCDRCDGFGQLAYPTRNPHLETQTCPKCTGNGYVLVGQAQTNVAQFPGAPAPAYTQPVGEIGPCPLCGTPNSAGLPHWCNPAAATNG